MKEINKDNFEDTQRKTSQKAAKEAVAAVKKIDKAAATHQPGTKGAKPKRDPLVLTACALGVVSCILSAAILVKVPDISKKGLAKDLATVIREIKSEVFVSSSKTDHAIGALQASLDSSFKDQGKAIRQTGQNIIQLNTNLKLLQKTVQSSGNAKLLAKLTLIEAQLKKLESEHKPQSIKGAPAKQIVSPLPKLKVVKGGYVARTPFGAIVKFKSTLLTISTGQKTPIGEVKAITNSAVTIGHYQFTKN